VLGPGPRKVPSIDCGGALYCCGGGGVVCGLWVSSHSLSQAISRARGSIPIIWKGNCVLCFIAGRTLAPPLWDPIIKRAILPHAKVWIEAALERLAGVDALSSGHFPIREGEIV